MLIKADMYAAGGSGQFINELIDDYTPREYTNVKSGSFYYETVPSYSSGHFGIDESGNVIGSGASGYGVITINYQNNKLTITRDSSQTRSVNLIGCYV